MVAQTSSSLTYSSLSSQLTAAVSSGSFNKYMALYGAKYGAPSLVNCTSSSIETVDESPSTSSDSSDSSLSQATITIILIVAIVLAVTVFFGVLKIKECCHSFSKKRAAAKKNEIDAEIFYI
jgi:beta-lactamase regulating signal transducer with metallopeptidase domain